MPDDLKPGAVPSAAAVAKVNRAFAAAGAPAEWVVPILQAAGDAQTAAALAKAAGDVARKVKASSVLTMDAALPAFTEALDSADTPEAVMAATMNTLLDGLTETDPAPRMGARVGHSWDRGEGLTARLTDALEAKLDARHKPTKGAQFAQASLVDLARMALRDRGTSADFWSSHSVIERATMGMHTTSDFPLILEGAISNTVARRLQVAQPEIRRAAHVVERSDYRASRRLSLSAASMPQEVNEAGEVKSVTANEGGEQNPTPRDFASIISLSNRVLVNDSTATSMLQDITARMVEGAVGRLRAVLLEPLLANSGNGMTMADGQPMFHSTHANLAGTATAITVAALNIARTAMRRQVGLNGEVLAIAPWALVVAPEKETEAQQVLADLAAAQVSNVNPFSGQLQLIVEPGLTAPNAWYVIADPSVADGLALSFLDGQQSPRIESRAGWERLAMEFRLHWPLDAKFVQHRTWFRNAGA